MAIIENLTPRLNNKLQNQPSLTIRESIELSTEDILVTEWTEHLHCHIKLSTLKWKIKIRLGHDDIINLVNQANTILNNKK